MANPYIFPIPEIECMIIDNLDFPKDVRILMLVNKYYYELIRQNLLFMEFKRFHTNKHKYFLREKSYKEKPFDENYHNFYLACKYHYPLIAKYLLRKYLINVRENDDYAFRLSCIGGDLNFVKFLFEFDKNINIHNRNELAFRVSCKYGNLEIAQWLYFLDNKIDVHTDNEYAFRISCKNGYIDVAKWLYSLDNKINIRMNNDEIFKIACRSGHIKIAKWLCTICDKYSFTMKLRENILK